MKERGDFKGRITFINESSLIALTSYAVAKDPNVFTMVLVVVACLITFYSVVLFGRKDFNDRLPVESSEYKAIVKGFVFMALLFFVGVGTVLLIAYLNDKGIVGPLNTVEIFRNCFVGYAVTTIMYNIFALSLLYKENHTTLVDLFFVCALISFCMVLFPDNLIAYCAFMVLIVFLDVVYGRYKVKA
ncbi:hypothetical protein [Coprothermobacter platensis]|uniref:hypothetical protein n=1 Tax=Coprothermobacter platensis TaxID=108819 RepID=UPI00036F5160|nr:hypothetical protein [Coprothermobacter platensis]